MFESPAFAWWCSITVGMMLVYAFGWGHIPPSPKLRRLDVVSLLSVLHHVVLKLFRTQYVLKCVFCAAVAAHAFEAMIAARVAVALKCSWTEVLLWTAQTFWVGFPSLRLLLAQRQTSA
jgi:hypothetical protein